MKKNIFVIIGIIVFGAFAVLSAQDSEEKKGNESKEKSYDFSGYMEAINSLSESINKKLAAYQEAAKKVFPKTEEKQEGTTIVLAVYERQFIGSFIPYFYRDYVVINGGKVTLYLEKTVRDLILEKAKALDKNNDGEKGDDTVPLERQRIIEVGSDAESISVTYRSSLGSDRKRMLSDFKSLRSQINILSQIRAQLVATERMMDLTIHRSELLQEFVNDKAIVEFEHQP